MAFLDIHPDHPQDRFINQAVQVLRKGGVLLYPTDSVYALGCDVQSKSGVEKMSRLKGVKPEKAMFSLLCASISQISEYTRQLDNTQFKILKNHLPGPFTFILNAGSQIPKQFQNRKKTLGLRIPDSKIVCAMIESLGRPLLSTSLPYSENDDLPLSDMDEIRGLYENRVDLIIGGHPVPAEPSTVVDLTDGVPELIREGLGEFEW